MKMLIAIGLAVPFPAPSPAAAADADLQTTVAVGDRVRAHEVGEKPVTAEVVEILPGALLVRPGPQAPPRRLDLSRLRRLELSRGRHGHADEGFWAGFVPGAVLGALAGGAACFDAQAPCDSSGESVIFGTLLGLAGGLFGAILGSDTKTERWEAVPLPGAARMRLTPLVPPVRGGMAAGVALRF